jgi:hypothetical protein
MQIVLWKNATSLYRTQHYCTELTQFFLLKNKTGQSFGKSIDKDLGLNMQVAKILFSYEPPAKTAG